VTAALDDRLAAAAASAAQRVHRAGRGQLPRYCCAWRHSPGRAGSRRRSGRRGASGSRRFARLCVGCAAQSRIVEPCARLRRHPGESRRKASRIMVAWPSSARKPRGR